MLEDLRLREESITEAASFEGWIHLGEYTHNPNKRSLEIMRHAYDWAVHADHGLANSFSHALKWAGIGDLYMELRKWN